MTDAAPLHHEFTGAGPGIPVLLLRPIAGTIELWGSFRDRLADHRPVIACEARGVGRSPSSALPTTTRGMARDAAALLDHLGGNAVHVFGLSLGGMVATWLAIDRPDLVRGLVLASTPMRSLDFLRAAPRGLGFAACLLRPAGAREACLTARVLSEPFRRDAPARTAAILAEVTRERGSLRSLVVQAAAGAAHAPGARLEQIRAPTLCLAGGLDVLVGLGSMRSLAAAIPGAELDVISDAGHDLSLEQPVELARRVAAFLTACERG